MSSQNNLVYDLLNNSRTVFTTQFLSMMTNGGDTASNSAKMHRYAKQGLLLNPRKGIYVKPTYNVEEMACSIFRPSYISLEYVLQRAGVVFQYDDTITCVSYLSRVIEIDGHLFSFRKISPLLWTGMEGITQNDNIYVATPERAFLDMVYLSAGNCYFDNLRPLNRKIIFNLLPRYNSKRLTEHINNFFK